MPRQALRQQDGDAQVALVGHVAAGADDRVDVLGVLDAVGEKAAELEIKRGAVQVTLLLRGGSSLTLGALIRGRQFRAPDPEKRGEEDRGTNYEGFAAMKTALQKRLLIAPGFTAEYPLRGEVAIDGCVVRSFRDLDVLVAVSGGTTEQDVAVAEAAILVARSRHSA